jgi:hypothetical protein
MSTRRARRLPASVRPARRTASPVEPAHIADLRHEGHRDKEGDAAHRLKSRNHGRHRPARHDGGELLLKGTQAHGATLDRVDGILENDLLRRMLEALSREPTRMGERPMLALTEYPAVT